MEERMDRRGDSCTGVCMGGGVFLFQPRRTSSREDV